MLRLGDKGPEVARLQTLLNAAMGGDLVVDGDFGTLTDGQLRKFQLLHALDPDGVAGPRTMGLLGPREEHPWAPGLQDRRAFASSDRVYGERSWSEVTGITLHQTACVLGERLARWDGIGCHVGITRGGQEIWLHDWTKLVVHGNGWNTRCVGIEMDGEYAGVEGDPTTVWNDPTTPWREVGLEPTRELIEQAKRCVRRICAEVAEHGGRVRFLVAHRQSSKDRPNDPGSALWQAVGLTMQAELGLTHGDTLDFNVGGYPIPESWDPRCVGVKY